MQKVLLLPLLLPAPAALAQQLPLSMPRSFAGLPDPTGVAELLERYHVPGVQLLYSRGTTTLGGNLGVAEAGTARRVTATTVFEGASLGKVVLAYVALRLHDRGLLDLNKPLLDYADYPRLHGQARAARITARMALAHTTGLPNWSQNPTEPGWDASPLAVRYAPDSCWSYSGEGYTLLQRTLEHISGKPWAQLAREEVFRPLGLKHSRFAWQPTLAATAAAGHDATGRVVPIDHFATPNAAFSLYTTAADYSRFLQAMVKGQGLKPATARLLQASASPARRCNHPATAADANVSWAYGVGLAFTSQGLAQWQWGDNTTFKGFCFALPDRRETLVVLTNSANGDQLMGELLRRFFGPGQYWVPQWLGLPE